MENDVGEVISTLMHKLRADSEADLARKLRIKQSTISSWKSRGNVPSRFRDIAGGASSLTLGVGPVYWSEQEKVAFGLALFRYCRLHCKDLRSGDFASAMATAGSSGDLWSLYGEAQRELWAAVETGQDDYRSAQAVLIHRDLEMGTDAIQRDQELVTSRRSRVEF